MKALKTTATVGLLCGAAALAFYNSDEQKVERAGAAVDKACHKPSGMTDQEAMNCTKATFNLARRVARAVESDMIIGQAVIDNCVHGPELHGVPDTTAYKWATTECFNAIDHNLTIDEKHPKKAYYQDMATEARYHTERAHTFLPPPLPQ